MEVVRNRMTACFVMEGVHQEDQKVIETGQEQVGTRAII